MFKKKTIFGNIAGMVFLLLLSGGAAAQMPPSPSQQTTQFRQIEQPLGLKIGVTAGGLALIGLELWWFIGNKTNSLK
ncbi:MAG: hypothetical protein PUP91_03185 [Rhizonema sp. PD37]|nr:hypothetical protein [Rhizonema sp. PD37]